LQRLEQVKEEQVAVEVVLHHKMQTEDLVVEE
jgi:hypothetical protein